MINNIFPGTNNFAKFEKNEQKRKSIPTCSAVLLYVLNPLTSAPFWSKTSTSYRFPLADALQSLSVSEPSAILVKKSMNRLKPRFPYRPCEKSLLKTGRYGWCCRKTHPPHNCIICGLDFYSGTVTKKKVKKVTEFKKCIKWSQWNLFLGSRICAQGLINLQLFS